jgi:osmotically-inducible protein OsmY
LTSAAGGALLAFFLDPRSGRRRRHTARDRVLSRARRTERRAFVGARRAEWRAVGAVRRLLSGARRREPPDDVTLAQKVGSTVFRDPRVPKGQISINAEDGVVFLRGMVEAETTIREIEHAARRVPGVRDVENLLHPPGTPAPASRPRSVRERAHS